MTRPLINDLERRVQGSERGLIRSVTATLAAGTVENTKHLIKPKFKGGKFRKRSCFATQWIEMSVRKVCRLKYTWLPTVTIVHPDKYEPTVQDGVQSFFTIHKAPKAKSQQTMNRNLYCDKLLIFSKFKSCMK